MKKPRTRTQACNTSHGLYFTGDQITIEDTPRLAKAAGVSLERRLEHGGGGGLTPGCGIWARLREG